MIIWLITGVLAAGGAFVAFYEPIDLWNSVYATGVVSFVYLIALLVSTMRSPFSYKTRVAVYVVFALFVFSQVELWQWEERKGHQLVKWWEDGLPAISEGAAYYETQKNIIPILSKYHSSQQRTKQTIDKVFLDIYPHARIGKSFRIPEHISDTLRSLYLVELSPHRIVVRGLDRWGRGRFADFKNVDGEIGKTQYRIEVDESGFALKFEN